MKHFYLYISLLLSIILSGCNDSKLLEESSLHLTEHGSIIANKIISSYYDSAIKDNDNAHISFVHNDFICFFFEPEYYFHYENDTLIACRKYTGGTILFLLDSEPMFTKVTISKDGVPYTKMALKIRRKISKYQDVSGIQVGRYIPDFKNLSEEDKTKIQKELAQELLDVNFDFPVVLSQGNNIEYSEMEHKTLCWNIDSKQWLPTSKESIRDEMLKNNLKTKDFSSFTSESAQAEMNKKKWILYSRFFCSQKDSEFLERKAGGFLLVDGNWIHKDILQIMNNLETNDNPEILKEEIEKICTLLSGEVIEESRKYLLQSLLYLIDKKIEHRIDFLIYLKTKIQISNLPENDKTLVQNAIKEKFLVLKKYFDEEVSSLEKALRSKSSISIRNFFETKYPIELYDLEYLESKIIYCVISMHSIDKISTQLILEDIPESIKKIIFENLSCESCRGNGFIKCTQCTNGVCRHCGGTGRKRVYSITYGTVIGNCTIKCITCKGAGKIKCRKCNASGLNENQNSRHLKSINYTKMLEHLKKTKSILDAQLDE